MNGKFESNNEFEVLEEISKKDFDKKKFVNLAITDENFRDFLINNMVNHSKIMKYYHCFYIIQDASKLRPDLFFKYWNSFVKLLNHKNSYHRDFGLILLVNILKEDKENRIFTIIDDYLDLLLDEKYSTAVHCVKNSFIIAKVKPQLTEKIVKRLILLESDAPYSEKQKALMMADIIDGFEMVYNIYSDPNDFLRFAEKHRLSISPKTRKVAKSFIDRFSTS